jgi:hypothetical protein
MVVEPVKIQGVWRNPKTPNTALANKWDAPRFQVVFNASAKSRFQALTVSHPLAANAHRWPPLPMVFSKSFDKKYHVMLTEGARDLLAGRNCDQL